MPNPPTPPAVVFLPTGERRTARPYEWFLSEVIAEYLLGPSSGCRPIFTRHELTTDQAERVRAIVEGTNE